MTRKYNYISELHENTCKTVVSNPQNWQAFLSAACRNYKLRFDEQLLVYAQRPDATAVLEIERWNRSFGRWVNRGAKGIAVFEDTARNRQRLTHYFDISDTHESRYSRPVPLWAMKAEYEPDVIEALESSFGLLENKDTLANAILSAANNAAEDNIPDYAGDLMYAVPDSFLEGLSEDMIVSQYRKLVSDSVAYMLMSRLGMDTSDFFADEDFREVTNFNTKDTLNALGYATSDISEMALSEISRTVMAMEKQNRILAQPKESAYNEGENKTERSVEHERTDIYDGRRLQSAELGNAATAGSTFGQIRHDEEELSEGTPQSPLLQSSDELYSDSALGGSRGESHEDGGSLAEADGAERGADRADESGGYDVVGAQDEQSEKLGAGDREDGSDLRLEYYDRSKEDKSLPFFGGDDTINEMLRLTPHLKVSKDEIAEFFESHEEPEERTEYIKEIFNHGITHLTLQDGRRVGYKAMQNVLHLWEGEYDNRTKQSFYDWGVIANHFQALRLFRQLYDTVKPLPSADGQLNFILDREAEDAKASAFTFSQEIIDAVLTRGSGISQGKMRIYEQFQKSLSAKENVVFLKNEYGWGGSYPVITGTGIDEQHDGKGIKLSKGIGDDKPNLLLKWTQVEQRIGELIRMDRYLNTKEKAYYPNWLDEQEQRRAERDEQKRNREILSTAPEEKPADKSKEEAYEYHLGDVVYIGANEYEILSFDDERVMLYDFAFPLFHKEFSRTEFDAKVRENPMNDHLKVRETPAEEGKEQSEQPAQTPSEDVLEQAKRIIDEYCREEFEQEEGADYTELTNVGLAYTTTEDEWHEIQARANLIEFKIETLVDQKVVRSEQFSSLEDMIENALQSLTFDDLVYVSDEEIERLEAPIVPVWEKQKQSKVKGYDLHPDISMSERHTFDLKAHEVEEVGKKERFRRNLMAIQLLKKCQEENRFATPEEQLILSKYVGWGGIPEAFDENNSAWATEYLELKTVLTPEEYTSARESTLTAFYTPPRSYHSHL